MRPIHEHEIRGARAARDNSPPIRRLLADVLPLPLLFGVLWVLWPLAFGEQAWWPAVGVAVYGGLGVAVMGYEMRRRGSWRSK